MYIQRNHDHPWYQLEFHKLEWLAYSTYLILVETNWCAIKNRIKVQLETSSSVHNSSSLESIQHRGPTRASKLKPSLDWTQVCRNILVLALQLVKRSTSILQLLVH